MEYYENELKSVLGNLVALYIRLTLNWLAVYCLQCIACNICRYVDVDCMLGKLAVMRTLVRADPIMGVPPVF